MLAISLIVGVAACGDDDGFVPPPDPPVVLDPDPPREIGAGQGRPTEVLLPDDYSIERRYPLVILLHGFGANGALQDFVFRLGDRVTRNQFILVRPDGTMNQNGERFWNGTPECCDFGQTDVDDVAYIAALIAEAKQLYAVDPARVRLAGHSNGGYMSYRYACEGTAPVDRIAVLAGSTFIDAGECRNPAEIDLLHMHGTRDDTILYEANLPRGEVSGVPTIGAEATVARWAARAGCRAEAEVVEMRDHHNRLRVGDDPAESDIVRYNDCADGRLIELWRGNTADHLYLSVNEQWRDDVAAFLSE